MKKMNILFLTSWVLGDSGANAAEIFPRLAMENEDIDRVLVADFPKNKTLVRDRIQAEYLKLGENRSLLRNAARIARKCRQEKIDVVHVFYRQKNAVLLIFVRLFVALLSPRTKLLMDHRSVNLAKGGRRVKKLILNQFMQIFTHHLAGNPWAVETNHFLILKEKKCIDLGYDRFDMLVSTGNCDDQDIVKIWYVGSLKPKNRKTEFLLDVFDIVHSEQSQKNRSGPKIQINVAGPARTEQETRLRKNPSVRYHGVLERGHLYKEMSASPAIGIAFMNCEYHNFAPSLKFSEYAIMRFKILASNTVGLKTQARRMQLAGVTFIPEAKNIWAQTILQASREFEGRQPIWHQATQWSYQSIFQRQVVPLYQNISRCGPCYSIHLEKAK